MLDKPVSVVLTESDETTSIRIIIKKEAVSQLFLDNQIEMIALASDGTLPLIELGKLLYMICERLDSKGV